jgi:hypothetical protein
VTWPQSSAVRGVLLTATLVLSPVVASVAQGDSAQRPTDAQLEREFDDAVRAAGPLAESLAGDTAGFLSSVQPYGPLDLVILKGVTPHHSDQLRNYFLGAVGDAAQIDPSSFANRWHCGPPCALARRDTLVQRLTQIGTLVREFRAMPRVAVAAVWPRGGYRFGLVSFNGKRYYRSTPSPILGLLPWRGEPADSNDRSLWGKDITRQAVQRLLAGMRTAGVVALVREEPSGIRAVLQGAIGDNEAGLLFLDPNGRQPPALRGVETLDGRRYLGAEQVAPGVYFYVTT